MEKVSQRKALQMKCLLSGTRIAGRPGSRLTLFINRSFWGRREGGEVHAYLQRCCDVTGLFTRTCVSNPQRVVGCCAWVHQDSIGATSFTPTKVHSRWERALHEARVWGGGAGRVHAPYNGKCDRDCGGVMLPAYGMTWSVDGTREMPALLKTALTTKLPPGRVKAHRTSPLVPAMGWMPATAPLVSAPQVIVMEPPALEGLGISSLTAKETPTCRAEVGRLGDAGEACPGASHLAVRAWTSLAIARGHSDM